MESCLRRTCVGHKYELQCLQRHLKHAREALRQSQALEHAQQVCTFGADNPFSIANLQGLIYRTLRWADGARPFPGDGHGHELGVVKSLLLVPVDARNCIVVFLRRVYS